MTTLSQGVHALFAEANLNESLHQLGTVQADADALKRQLAEVQHRIPTWDRIVFFSDTQDEKLEKDLTERLKQARVKADTQRKVLEETIDAIAERFPPIGLWRQIDRCAGLARTELQVTGWRNNKVAPPRGLIDALHELAHQIQQLYIPDFDPTMLAGPLRDEDTCQRTAVAKTDVVHPHPQLGFEPISMEQLVGLVAGQLLQSGFFQVEGRLERLEARRKRLHKEWNQAGAQVSALDDINILSKSPQEQARDQIGERALKARQEWIAADEDSRRVLMTHMDAYPPLKLYRQVGAALGMLSALGLEQETHINAQGKVAVRRVVVPRALVQEAIKNLRRSFVRIFPGLPLPSLALKRTQRAAPGGVALLNSPRHQVLRDFTQAMDRREGQTLLAQSLVHASMLHAQILDRRALKKEVSWLDHAAFWSDSQAQRDLHDSKERAAVHRGALEQCWQQLMAMARHASAEQAPLLIRDRTVATSLNLRAITTQSSPCRVSDHRNRALAALSEMRAAFTRAYGITGDRQNFMADVAHALAQPPRAQRQAGPFARRTPPEIVHMVADQLRQTSFRLDFLACQKATAGWQQQQTRQKEAKANISFWDWVNVFSDTDAEKAKKDAARNIKALNKDIQALSQRTNALLDQALVVYPPAQLYLMIDGVHHAIGRIYAKMVTRTYRDSKGRTRTRRTCSLFNKTPAVNAMDRWNATLLQTFGHLPSSHECLEWWVSF